MARLLDNGGTTFTQVRDIGYTGGSADTRIRMWIDGDMARFAAYHQAHDGTPISAEVHGEDAPGLAAALVQLGWHEAAAQFTADHLYRQVVPDAPEPL